MRVLQVSSEATPFAKTGGLADVAGALPDSLGRAGCECTLVVPAYREVFEKNVETYSEKTIRGFLPGFVPSLSPFRKDVKTMNLSDFYTSPQFLKQIRRAKPPFHNNGITLDGVNCASPAPNFVEPLLIDKSIYHTRLIHLIIDLHEYELKFHAIVG